MIMETSDMSMKDALRLLAYRPRSEYELIMRLGAKGYSKEQISVTTAQLRKWGYIDDQKFTELWVQSRLLNKPMGTIRLKKELREKGISNAIIESTIENAFDDTSEFQIARNLAYSKMDTIDNWAKVAGILKRRGFSYDIIISVGKSLGITEEPNER